MSTKIGISWVYQLKRDDLVKELRKHKIEESGTVPELKKRLATFVKANPFLFIDRPTDNEGYDEEVDKTID